MKINNIIKGVLGGALIIGTTVIGVSLNHMYITYVVDKRIKSFINTDSTYNNTILNHIDSIIYDYNSELINLYNSYEKDIEDINNLNDSLAVIKFKELCTGR